MSTDVLPVSLLLTRTTFLLLTRLHTTDLEYVFLYWVKLSLLLGNEQVF